VAAAAPVAAAKAPVAGPSKTRSAPVPRFLIPSVTPVDRAGNFDEPLWRDMLAFYGDKGADGVLVLGTTASSPRSPSGTAEDSRIDGQEQGEP